MAAASSAPVDRLALLSEFHTKIKDEELETLHERFDIPPGFKLTLPEKDSVAYEHGGDKAPLYITHLEYGLCLPLPAFVRKLCERLGVSPMQFAPNAIAAIMAFLVICYRLKIEPSLQFFSNLVNVKTNKKDAHFFFIASGPRLANIPESNKDWKEKFVWISNADPILVCPTWPEIRKGALKTLPLSPSERADLARIRGYAGSRDISNLFDPATLRVAGLSHIRPTEEDERAAQELAEIVVQPTADKGVDSGPAEGAVSQLPQKKLRIGLSSEEREQWSTKMDVMASMLISPATTSDVKGPEKKKEKGAKKTTQKGRKSKSKTSDLAGATSKDASPLSGQQAPESTSHLAGGVVVIDDSSPQRGDVHHESTQEAPMVDSGSSSRTNHRRGSPCQVGFRLGFGADHSR